MAAPVHVLMVLVTWREKFMSSRNIENVFLILVWKKRVLLASDCQQVKKKYQDSYKLVNHKKKAPVSVLMAQVVHDGTGVSVHLYITHIKVKYRNHLTALAPLYRMDTPGI